MPAKWKTNKTFKPTVIIERLGRVAKVGEGGRVSYDAMDHHKLTVVLQSMLTFDSRTPWPVRKSSMSKALAEVVRNATLDKDSYLKELNQALKFAMAQKEQKLSLLTSLSVTGERVHTSIKIRAAKIRFLNDNFAGKYKTRSELEKSYQFHGSPTPANYQKVIVSLKSRHMHDAFNQCLRELDIYRGLLCLFTNYSMQYSFGNVVMPINRIVLGSMHTLHKENGEVASDNQYWYEPYHDNPKPISIKKDRIKIIKKNIDWILGKLQSSTYGDKLIEPLIRYVRAFDDRDANSVAIKMWGALEAMSTDAGPGSNCDALVRRCAFVVADSELHIQQLEALREFRNQSVHAGESSEDAKTYCYQMQYYFQALFMFHVSNCDYFSSIHEANQFLDLPRGKSTLERRRLLVEKAIKFRS